MHTALDKVEAGVKIDGSFVNSLRFADDIDLIAETAEQLQELTDKVNTCSKRFGLKINAKRHTMTIGRKHEELKIMLEKEELEQVKEFVYLGSVMTEDGKCVTDIRLRIALVATRMGKFNKVRKSSRISTRTKMMTY